MKSRWLIPRIFLIFLCLFPAAASQAVESVFPGSDQSNTLDNTNPSARASALGSSFVTMDDDAAVLFTNPAGLAYLKRGQLEINSHFWLVDTFQETLLLGIPGPAAWGGFGLAGSYLSYGMFEGRDDLGSLAPQYSADRLLLKGSWGMEILQDFSVGAGLSGSQTSLAGSGFGSLAADFGVLVKFNDKLRLGAAYDNVSLSSQIGKETSAFNFGGSYEIPLDSISGLWAAMSGVIQSGVSANYLQAGLEYAFRSRFFLRAGCQIPLNDNKITGFDLMTAGVGVALSDLTLDYAFQPYGELGSSHRISIGYRFDTKDLALDPANRMAVPREAAVKEGDAAEKSSLVVEFDIPPDSIVPGIELEKRGKYREAVEFYQESIGKNRTDASAWWALGDLYRRFNMKDYAVRCFNQVVKLEPDNKKMGDWLEKYKVLDR